MHLRELGSVVACGLLLLGSMCVVVPCEYYNITKKTHTRCIVIYGGHKSSNNFMIGIIVMPNIYYKTLPITGKL